jgi:hypothetical protein
MAAYGLSLSDCPREHPYEHPFFTIIAQEQDKVEAVQAGLTQQVMPL